MNLTQLTATIQTIIQDDAYDAALIKMMINDAVLRIATGETIPGRHQKTPPLPELYTTGTVLTDATGIVSLPADFNRDAVQVVNSSYESIPIDASPRRFIKANPELTAGAVSKCTVLGGRLAYRDIPSATETLTIHYHKAPTTLSASTDTPSCIPAHLHRDLIVSGVCKIIFDEIEDGVDDPKTNTRHHEGRYQIGLMELVLAIGEDGEPDYYDCQVDRCP